MNTRGILLVMLSVLVIVGASWTVQRELTRQIDQLRMAKRQIEIRNIIYTDLVACLHHCKALLFQAPLSSMTPEMFHHYLRRIYQKFEKTREAFRILEHGGEYRRVVPLNLPEHAQYREGYRLAKGMEIPPQLSPAPQLQLLKEKIGTLDRLVSGLLKKEISGEGEARVPLEFRRRLATVVKELDAIYRRLIENINQMLYLDEKATKKIVQERDRLSAWQRNLRIFTVSAILVLVLLLGLLSIRRLTRLNGELSRRLYRDALTGLKSRAALEERGVGAQEGVLLIDILNFREINDLYGMRTGDEVLRRVARRLEKLCRQEDLYHLGGNTFAVVFPVEKMETEEIERIATEKINALQKEAYLAKGMAFYLRFCAGVGEGEQGVDRAMIALDEAKQRNLSVVVYHEGNRDFLQRIRGTRSMQHLIHEAISQERVEPFVQPIIDREGNRSNYEMLMRIRYGNGLYMLPDFEVAIASRLYGMLSRQMIRKSFACMKGLPMSLNLNYEDIRDEETNRLLEELLRSREEEDPPVTFEILENVSITDFQVVERFIDRFRSQGVKIAIDDFGSDYSNLFRILKLSPDYLKIDGSLIRHIVETPEAYEAVRSIVAYAKNLGIKTVAEYVRNHTTYRQCLELDIDYFQGFYFHRPFPASALRTAVERQEPQEEKPFSEKSEKRNEKGSNV